MAILCCHHDEDGQRCERERYFGSLTGYCYLHELLLYREMVKDYEKRASDGLRAAASLPRLRARLQELEDRQR